MKNTTILTIFLISLGVVAFGLFPAYGNAKLTMPTARQIAKPGQYTERYATEIQLLRPDTWEYEPSSNIRDSAVVRKAVDGISIRTWYELSPQPNDKKMPLVLAFHGGGRDGLSMLEMWSETATRHGLLVVAPNAPAGERWPFANPNPAFLHRIIKEALSRHNVDEDRILLFGHSDGAGYAQVILNRTKGPWTAAAVHAGLSARANLHVAVDPKPLRLFLGSRDAIFELSEMRQAAQEFAATGHDTDLLIISNHNHWFYEIGPQIAEHSWTWFDDLSLNSNTSKADARGLLP